MTSENTPGCGCEDACSLPPDELRDRKTIIRREILPNVTRRQALANGWALDFQHTPVMQQALEDLIVFERECCSGLSWNLDRPAEDVLRLRIEGLAPSSDFFAAMHEGAAGPGRVSRIAKAGGLGAAVSLLVCCVAPIGLAAVVGSAAAAPLARLDDPVFLAGGALAAGLPAWLWLRRRDRARC